VSLGHSKGEQMKQELQKKLKQSKRENISWFDFEQFINKIISEMKNSGYIPDYVYGIPRGGLPLSVTLSNRLGISMIFDLGLSQAKSGSKILVVDDISDTGDTLKDIKQEFVANGCQDKLKIATLLYRQGTQALPDFFGKYLPTPIDSKGYTWINFPWEEK
jgi:xanthine phosphoribosyltransferase